MNRLRKKSEKQSHLQSIASKKKKKTLGINLMKKTKDLVNANLKTLKREVKEDIRKWKDLPCSWISRISIVKMATLTKTIYMFNGISIKIPMTFFTDL
jgi:hypothetical protein